MDNFTFLLNNRVKCIAEDLFKTTSSHIFFLQLHFVVEEK